MGERTDGTATIVKVLVVAVLAFVVLTAVGAIVGAVLSLLRAVVVLAAIAAVGWLVLAARRS